MAFHRSTCPFCSCGCGLLLQDDHGRLVGSYPTVEPPARSSLCVRGWNATGSWSHTGRLTVPMVRGQAGLVRATWREAVEAVAGRLRSAAHPPLFAIGPSLANEDAFALRRLAERLGGRACTTDLSGSATGRLALRRVMGTDYSLRDPDAVSGADLVWVLGVDAADCPQVTAQIGEARRRGAKLARFDVYASAPDGSRVVTVAPGRFGDVALDLQRAVFEADIATPDARRAAGYDALSHYWQQALASGSPPRARECDSLTLAREFLAASRPVVIVGSRWLTSAQAEPNTSELLQAIALLGGRGRLAIAAGEANSWGVLDMLGAQAVPAADVACREAGLDALIVAGDDLVRRSPRPASLVGALSGLQTLIVVDRFETDCTALAHVVLPACAFAEADGSVTSLFGHVQRWRQVVAPPGECQPERVWASRIGELFGAAGHPSTGRGWFEALQAEVEGYRGVAADGLYPEEDDKSRAPDFAPSALRRGDRMPAATVRDEAERLTFSAPAAEPGAATDEGEGEFTFRLVVGSLTANWSTGVVSQKDEILRREAVESTLAASPAALKTAGVKPGWPVRLLVSGGEATVTARSDPRLPDDVLVLVPLAGSPAAALRGSLADPGGRSVGLQPVSARIERVQG